MDFQNIFNLSDRTYQRHFVYYINVITNSMIIELYYFITNENKRKLF